MTKISRSAGSALGGGGPTRAAAYCRVSLEEQAREGVSLSAQQDRISAYCTSQGWDLVEIYIDPGYSGKNLKRPALTRALNDAKAHRFDVLLVQKVDRLSRRQRDVLHIVEDLLDPYQVGLRSITENFDTTTPAGKAMLGMLSVFAQLERETLQERTRVGKDQAAKEGRRLGPPPYGYAIKDGLLAPVEPEASFVRELFRRYVVDGTGIQKLVSWANSTNNPHPKRGKLWHYNQLRIILRNSTYAGRQPHNGNDFAANHEAIVSAEIFDHAQNELLRRRDTHSARVRAADYLLSGVGARCGLCGAPMHGHRYWTNWPREPRRYTRAYLCSRRHPPSGRSLPGTCTLPWMRQDNVEAAVIAALRRYVWDEDFLHSQLDRAHSDATRETAEREQRLHAIRSELADIQQRIARWYDAFETGALSPGDLAERTRALKQKKEHLEELIMELSAPHAPTPDANTTRTVDRLRDMAALIEVADKAAIQQFLRECATAVVVFEERVEVRLLGL